MTRCVFVCEFQEKEEDEKKKAGAQIKEKAKDAKPNKEFREVKKREDQTAKEAKEVDNLLRRKPKRRFRKRRRTRKPR